MKPRHLKPRLDQTVAEPSGPTESDVSPLVNPPPSPPRGTARFPSGTRLGNRYRIGHLLGRGGMGEVYLAEDLKLEQSVALKFLPQTRLRNAAWRQRFLDEIKTARQISHPNVCRVYDLEEFEGHLFLSMEYIEGENLAVLLRQVGRLPRTKAIEIGQQICQGLAAIHECGFLHRDLKPANLMIDRAGRAFLTDFGLAVGDDPLDRTSLRQGTPAYMAPEQRAGQVSVQSDLYALGLVLYKLFTGRSAFATPGEEWPESDAMPTPPSHWVEAIDASIDRIILQCLSASAEGRPTSALAVAAALAPSDSDPERAFHRWQPDPGLELPQRPHWTILRKVGQGGFGEVWLAKHQKTHEQRVFKFCRDEDRRRSLEREITLFRLLKHTLGHRRDIASILDWNFEHPPYFLEAEYSEEGSLTEWSETLGGLDQVPLATRLELVAQVATALAAAHSVGVLHKDVKPGNILISRQDGHPQAQLSDFGIGALVDHERLRDAGITLLGWSKATHQTSTTAAGTLLYRAPELFEGKPPSLQADIYALGVLLYQMVIGDLTRALAPGWEKAVDDEILREDIASCVASLPDRLSDAQQLADRLRTLEVRRENRLQEERQREQALRAFKGLESAQRRRRAFAFGFLLMVFFTTVMWFQSRRAEREAQSAQQIATFLENLYADLEPGQARGDLLTVRDLLRRGSERIDQELDGQPWTQAKLYQTIGNVYHSLGLHESAIPPLEKALEIRRELHREPHLEIAESLQFLGYAVHELPDFERAHRLLNTALEMQHRLLPETHPELAKTHDSIAKVFYQEGKPSIAETHARLALGIRAESLGHADANVAESQDLLAYVLHAQGRNVEAEELFEEALRIRRNVFPPEHHSIAASLKNLGYMLRIRGHHLDAEPLFRETLKIQRHVLGSDHPEVGFSLRDLALSLVGIGDYEAAEEPLLEALGIYQRLEDTEGSRALILTDLGSLYTKQRDFAKAHDALNRALSIHQGLDNKLANIGFTLDKVGDLWQAQGVLDAAEEKFLEALAHRREILGNKHPEVAFSLINLGNLAVETGDAQKGESLFQEALEMQRTGKEHKTITLRALRQLALLFQSQGDYGRAEEYFLQAIDERQKARKRDNLHLAVEFGHLAKLYLQKGDLELAETNYHRAMVMMQSVLPERSWKLAYLKLTQGAIQIQVGRLREAETTLGASAERLENGLGLGHPHTQESLDLLAQLRGLLPSSG